MRESIFIDKSSISGEVTAYPSKSQIQRALILGLLNKKGMEITNYAESEDSSAVLRSVKNMGADFLYFGSSFKIRGPEKINKADVSCSESGLCLRLFAPVLALTGYEHGIFGKETLLRREDGQISEVLSRLGCKVTREEGSIKVKGPFRSGRITIADPPGSQLISGLLFALSFVDGDSEIILKNPVSFPYIEMTARMLNQFGAGISLEGRKKITIKGNRELVSGKLDIEGDWSSSAILLTAGAVCGEVTVRNLDHTSTQADREILSYLEKAGAQVLAGSTSVTVKKNRLSGFRADITDHPDLFVPLVVLGLNCEGETRIYNCERLKNKESDRPSVMISELKKAGAQIEMKRGFISVKKSSLNYAELDPHGDHRMAMGFSAAALNSEKGLKIFDPGCVSKSFPYFFEALKYLKGEGR